MATTDLWRELFVVSGVLDRLKSNSDKAKTSESKNIISVFEQSVFLWHASDQKLITATLKSLDITDKNGVCGPPQTLFPINSPSYDVENIQINGCGHLLSLSGKRGISIVELPQRWGGQNNFEGGKEIIMCKTWNIADRFFSCSKRIQTLQVLWHPGSNAHTHLVVLSNDNYLRIYNVINPQTPLVAVSLGPQSRNYYLTSMSQMTFSGCLGEVAVSFDFGPPNVDNKENENNQCQKLDREDVIWPVFILNGNGDVYILDTCLSQKIKDKKFSLLGPLSMHPPADDNYGVDACNLICLQSTPPVLVITTCAGIVHHCIVLHTAEFEEKEKHVLDTSDFDIDALSTISSIGLFVFESIELSLSLTEGDEMLSYPIRLFKDQTSAHRYHCTHSSGLHAVQLPFLQHLERFTTDEQPFDSNLLTELEEKQSIVEHLICTRPFPSSTNAPVLGLAVASTTLGATLICLLSSWEAVFLPLRSHSIQVANLQTTAQSESPLSNAADQGFVQKLLQWLQCSTHTPLLKTPASYSPGTEPSVQQCVELLSNVTQSFREEFLQRLQIAHGQLKKRSKVLSDQKVQILFSLVELLKDREILSDKAESLAERYEDVHLKQQQLMLRVEHIAKNLQLRIPVLSDEEVNMHSELQASKEQLKQLQTSMEHIHLKFTFQQQQTEKDELSTIKREISYRSEISSNQANHIKVLISKEGASISNLIKRVTWLKKDLSI